MDSDNEEVLGDYINSDEEVNEDYINSDNELVEYDSDNEEIAAGSATECNNRIAEDGNDFQVISTQQIFEHMVHSIKEVNTILGISVTTTRILLNHFTWDKQKLLEQFYSDDQEKLFEEAGVVNPFENNSTNQPSHNTTSNESDLCEICFLSVPGHDMFQLNCEHRFCIDCWNVYLRTKIMEEGLSQTIACAAHNCKILVDDVSVMQLIRDSNVKLKYQVLITNSFVECNRELVWCPAPNCDNAVKIMNDELKHITCKCGHNFCFQCLNDWHDPIKCNILRKWLKKCQDDSETSNWISANTKDCPKCTAIIEKNGGCNHMTCRNLSCRFEFCWICLRDWSTHLSFTGYYCNRYDDKKLQINDKTQTSRVALERYLFYYNRYMNHMQSLKLEEFLHEKVQKKIQDFQEQFKISWIEIQFLKKAAEILCRCRQTLMYSYIFPYYLQKNNQSTIFEDNQQDLESATEYLSGYLEEVFTEENITREYIGKMKQKIQNKYNYCSSRRDVLLQHVKEGYERDWWVYMKFN